MFRHHSSGFLCSHRIATMAILLATFLLACSTVEAQVNERTKKVLADRAKITAEGFWIYNDLPAAFEQARRNGKPILVVLRCLPCEECVKLDDEVVDHDPVIRPLLEQFVCVRVVSTNGLDLSLFQFDTDQSFAVFMLRDEHTIYGRFGTRSHRTDWLGDVSMLGFAEALRGALELHQTWPTEKSALISKIGTPPQYARPELLPSLQQRNEYSSKLNYSGDVVKSCIHCHQIGDAIRDEFRSASEPIPEKILYPYPHPKSIGLILDPTTRGTIREVLKASPAENAGLQNGDQILRMQGQLILSTADIQWVLHNASPQDTAIQVLIEREQTEQTIDLVLPEGWRQNDDISWRVSTWGLRRMASGGMRLDPLSDEDRAALQFDPGPAAMKVKSVGQYGPHAAAKKAGFQVGDIVTEIDGRTDLRSETDLLEYGVTQLKPGDKVTVTVFRDGEKRTLLLPMQK
ncbi:serine endoprotease [Allorhodopirellula heiligendammensis]|uniref:Serine endoprotease n=2 Tax=Allorhodopirellula heiligendammensis TaxID=2714739 RepID=A0A5C6BWN5_9BACT|nr:serine endoprotease [Allorhodopirellula heiligendammensis]